MLLCALPLISPRMQGVYDLLTLAVGSCVADSGRYDLSKCT